MRFQSSRIVLSLLAGLVTAALLSACAPIHSGGKGGSAPEISRPISAKPPGRAPAPDLPPQSGDSTGASPPTAEETPNELSVRREVSGATAPASPRYPEQVAMSAAPETPLKDSEPSPGRLHLVPPADSATPERSPASSPTYADAPMQPGSDVYSIRAKVSQALGAMTTANFAFNAPETLELNTTAQIELKVSLAQSVEQLKSEIVAGGQREGGTVKVSNRIEARLTGINFDINAISDAIQPIGELDTVDWRWDIKPIEEGEQVLHLSLTAIITVDGKDMTRTIRTLDKKIVVQVSSTNRAGKLLEKYWQWLMTAVLIPLFGWAARKLRSRQAATAVPAS
jgi:hypothetical protein